MFKTQTKEEGKIECAYNTSQMQGQMCQQYKLKKIFKAKHCLLFSNNPFLRSEFEKLKR
jgi:hypothetical protein